MPPDDVRPPDPSSLTTHHLEREVRRVEDLLDDKVEARHAEQSAQTKGYEAQLAALREVVDVKFEAVDKQFEAVERARKEAKDDTKEALDAALAAAKEAVRQALDTSDKAITKSEAANDKRAEATDKIVDDLKDRMKTLEAEKKGGLDMRVAIMGVVALLITMGGFAVTIFAVMAANGVFG